MSEITHFLRELFKKNSIFFFIEQCRTKKNEREQPSKSKETIINYKKTILKTPLQNPFLKPLKFCPHSKIVIYNIHNFFELPSKTETKQMINETIKKTIYSPTLPKIP